MRGTASDGAVLAESRRNAAAAVAIQGRQVFPWGQLPNYRDRERRAPSLHGDRDHSRCRRVRRLAGRAGLLQPRPALPACPGLYSLLPCSLRSH